MFEQNGSEDTALVIDVGFMSAKTIVLCVSIRVELDDRQQTRAYTQVFLGHVGVWLASADLYQTRDDQETTVIFTFDVNASTIETTVAVNEQSSLPTETTRSNSSFTSEGTPLFFYSLQHWRTDQRVSSSPAVFRFLSL